MEDACAYEAFAADSIANLLEQRARFTPEASALHLTRREDLLEVQRQPPDLSISQAIPHPATNETSASDTMAENNEPQNRAMPSGDVEHSLRDLNRSCIVEHYGELAKQAAGKQWSHVDYRGRLIEGEAHVRRDHATPNRIRQARFPVIKTLEQFRWDGPTPRNRLQVQHHFGRSFLKDKANLIYLGGVGVGKTHLATALGSTACLQGYAVLLASAIAVINPLAAAKQAGRLKQERKKATQPALLILDELGDLPLDKSGADLLFQVISLRYEQGSILLTSNRAFKEWPTMFHTERLSGNLPALSCIY